MSSVVSRVLGEAEGVESKQSFVRVAQSLARDSSIRVSAKAVFLAVASYANNDTGLAWPSHARLAADTGTSVSTVKRSLRELRNAGYVDWTLRYDRTAVYRVWQPSRGKSGELTLQGTNAPQVAAESGRSDERDSSGHSKTTPVSARQFAVLVKNYEASNLESPDCDTRHVFEQFSQADAHREIVATKRAYFHRLTQGAIDSIDWCEISVGKAVT